MNRRILFLATLIITLSLGTFRNRLVGAQATETDTPFFVAITKSTDEIYAFPITDTPTSGEFVDNGTVAGVADFDNDGVLEVLAASDSDRQLRLYEGTIGAGFSAEVASNDAYPSTGFALYHSDSAVADFDNNGYMDFAFTGRRCTANFCPAGGEDLLQLHLNNGDGTYSRVSLGINDVYDRDIEHPAGLDSGDFNADGNFDLAVQHYWSYQGNDTHILLGNGDGSFAETVAFSRHDNGGTPSLVAGDFDEDGAEDLIVGQDEDYDAGQTWLYLGNGDGTFRYSSPAYDTNPLESVTNGGGDGEPDAYDVNSDSTLDIIVPAHKIGLLLYIGNGDGSFQEAIVLDAGEDWYRVAAPPTVVNAPPTVSAGGPYIVDEGGSITLAATGDDPEGDTLNYDWDLDDNGSYEISGQSVSFSAAGLDGPSSHTVNVQVTDPGGLSATDEATINVHNVAPSVGLISAPADPVLVSTEINVSADFTDPGILDTHTAEWAWGDGSTSPGTVTETDGSGSVSDTYTYTEPGVYTVKLTVTDKDGESDESIYQYVVVYDPDGGFVTGGGSFDSPVGAYKADPAATGKANFGFVSKYKKGATVPAGNTEFQFKAGNLNFHSDTYEWLVVTGSNYANFKGEGTINGDGDANDNPFKFKLWAGDGDPDTFRIKIWFEDADGSETVVYDNGMDQTIGGGSIVVHD